MTTAETVEKKEPDTTTANGSQTGLSQRRGSAMTSRGVSFGTVADLWNFAGMVAKSGLAPKGLERPEAITVAIQMGLEIGLSPMASLQNIAVINGRPSLWGDAMLAVCRNSGVFCEETFSEEITGDGDNRTATCIVRRLPNGKPYKSTFSVADARRAGLWGKAGPWTQYPDRMLKMRARGFALRDLFGDFLRGMYSAEEVHDGVGEAERIREIPSVSTAPTKAAALVDELKQRMSAEPQTAEKNADAPADTAAEEEQQTAEASEEPAPRALSEADLEDWKKRIAAANNLTFCRGLEDQAMAIPMPDRQQLLDMIHARENEIRAARGDKAAEKGKLI